MKFTPTDITVLAFLRHIPSALGINLEDFNISPSARVEALKILDSKKVKNGKKPKA